MLDILVSGLLLSGTYALVAMGLNLQYGVARIMNLANGAGRREWATFPRLRVRLLDRIFELLR